jgi:hypothetical protein
VDGASALYVLSVVGKLLGRACALNASKRIAFDWGVLGVGAYFTRFDNVNSGFLEIRSHPARPQTTN